MSTAVVTPEVAVPPPVVLAPAPKPAKASAKASEAAPATAAFEVMVSRDTLLAEILAAQQIVSSKTTIPILGNLLLEARDGALYISATNLEQSLQTRIPATVKRPGVCTVPSRKLVDYIRLLPSGDILLKLLDNAWVQIQHGRSRTKMVGMDRSNYPALPSPGSEAAITLGAGTLRALLSRTISSVSEQESRYTLQAALFHLEPKKARMVATDGHRLAIAEHHFAEALPGLPDGLKLLIPSKALHDLTSLLGNTQAESVSLYVDETTMYFRLGERLFSSRRTIGNFPNYEGVIPRGNNRMVSVGCSDLGKTVQRVSQFADEKSNGVMLDLTSGALKVASQSPDHGESEEILEAAYTGERVSIQLNASYLMDYIKATGGTGDVRLRFKDGASAAALEPDNNTTDVGFMYVIMPMRV